MKFTLLAGCTLLLATGVVARKDGQPRGDKRVPEPPFPRFMDGLVDNKVLRIVSEVLDDSVGYQTNEEYIDVHRARAVHVVTNIRGQKIAYSDARYPNQTYVYWPYECKTVKLDERVFDNSDDTNLELNLFRKEKNHERRQYGQLRLFGALAIWALVQDLPKRYSRATSVYSTSKNVNQPAHVWEAKLKDGNIASLHFVEADYEPDDQDNGPMFKRSKLTLEVIQIARLLGDDTRDVIRTFNMVYLDWVFIEAKVNNLLQIPVGYGCPGFVSSGNSFIDNYIHNHRAHAAHRLIELEVTETVMEQKYTNGIKHSQQKATTVSVQFFSTDIMPRGQHLEMLRIRNDARDVKLVTYEHLSVKYLIDYKTDSCEVLNIAEPTDQMILYMSPDTDSKFELNPKLLRYLLEPPDGPEFIKESRTPNFGGPWAHVYYERAIPWPIDVDKMASNGWYTDSIAKAIKESAQFARIIRNFAKLNEMTYVLESITIWVFDRASNKITKSYHLSVLNEKNLDAHHQQARLLDITEECYLNSDDMRSGRDYAWIELFYPISSRNNDLLAKDEWKLKEQFYSQIFNGDNFKLNVLRFPQLELMFGDEGFQVRMLLLDMPPIEKIYTKTPGKALKNNNELGELAFLSPDIKHCAQLCRIHNCNVFSYCESTKQCTTASPSSNGSAAPTLDESAASQAKNCSLYEMPDSLILEELHQSSLHSMLSKLQFHDYSIITVPKVPEELQVSPEESGLDEQALRKLYQDYQHELMKCLVNLRYELNELVLLVNPADHPIVILPSKFVIEDDPLDSFDLVDRETSDALRLTDSKGTNDNLLGNAYEGEQIADYFRQGLPSSRYKFLSFPDDLKLQARRISGLTYDQCALSCLDTKCGSFSYCPDYKECTITNLNSTRLAQEADLISNSAQCFIAQRDFLRNFNQYPSVYRPQAYRRLLDTKTTSTGTKVKLTPSDCALECVSETSFRCMSFEICHLDSTSTCFFQDQRHPKGIYGSGQSSLKASNTTTTSGCDHFERSYLADFNHVEYRQIEQTELAKLVTSTYQGKSSFQCADICVNELPDCSGFQFCFRAPQEQQKESADSDTSAEVTAISMQTCTMIQSKPTSSEEQEGLSVEFQESAGIKTLKSGKFIKPSESCHIFSLRASTSEAHLRDLALENMMTLEAIKEREAREAGLNRNPGLSLKSCFILFLSVTSVSMALGFGICLARDRNEFIRQKLERGRLLLGI